MTTTNQEATVPHPQEQTNTEAARWLADVLDRWGLNDPGDRAEWVVAELVERGVRPVPALPPLRGSGSTDANREAAKAKIDKALAEARKRTALARAGERWP